MKRSLIRGFFHVSPAKKSGEARKAKGQKGRGSGGRRAQTSIENWLVTDITDLINEP